MISHKFVCIQHRLIFALFDKTACKMFLHTLMELLCYWYGFYKLKLVIITYTWLFYINKISDKMSIYFNLKF